jgi:hypothetical protein
VTASATRPAASADARAHRRERAGWWFEPVPVARLDVLARVAYVVILFYVWINDWFSRAHAHAPESFYRPVFISRLLHVPAPSPAAIVVLEVVITAGCLVGVSRRAPRATAAVVLVAYGLWISWCFGYGKVDHDRLTMLVALLAFACTPRTGPDRAEVEAQVGWAFRVIQVVFVLAYPFSAITKLRLAGLRWPQSAVFARAIIRRGSDLGDLLLTPPWVLQVGQWAFLAFELFAIVALVRRGPLRTIALVGILFLHVFTYATIGIHFGGHTMFLLAFLPLERFGPWLRRTLSRAPADPGDSTEPGTLGRASSP